MHSSSRIFSFLVGFVLVSLLVGFSSSVVSAQSRNKEPAVTLTSNPRVGRADVAVHDLRLEQVFYGSGDVIEGEFKLTNIGEQSIGNLKYSVELVGNFTNRNIPQTIYNYGEISDGITLTRSENKTIRFSYTLPDPLPANSLGIQIKLYEGSERMLARTSISFGTNGETYDYLEHIAQVQIDGEPFGLLDAPIAFEGERMFFAVSLQNGTQALNLTPEISIYNRLLSGEKVTSYNAAKLFINRFDTKEQRIELPVFDYKPGIYTALITYKDEEGIIRSGPFEVRYIVAELKPQIESVAVSENILEARNEIVISVALSDAPLDIRTNNYEDSRPPILQDMKVLITLYDSEGDVIVKDTATIDELGIYAQLKYVPTKDALGFRIVADLIEGETLVDRIEQIYTASETETSAFLEKEKGNVFIVATIFFGTVLIILLVTYLLLRKYKKDRGVSTLLPLLLLTITVSGFSTTAIVSADMFIAAYGERATYIPTNFQINSPRSSAVETYALGEIVPFQIDLWSQNINASLQDASVRISSMYVPRKQEKEEGAASVGLEESEAATVSTPTTDDDIKDWTEWQKVGSTRGFNYSQNNIPWTETLTMQAPEVPGVYRVDFQIKNNVTWTLGQTHENFYEGYFEVVVIEPEPLAPLPDGIIVEAEVE